MKRVKLVLGEAVVLALVTFLWGYWVGSHPFNIHGQAKTIENREEAKMSCVLGRHDLPDPEDAWEAGWPIGGEGGTTRHCLRCGRLFRLAPREWIDVQAEKGAWEREAQERARVHAEASKRVEAWEARRAAEGR